MKEVYYPLPKDDHTTYIKNAGTNSYIQDDGLNGYIKGKNNYAFREIYLRNIKKHIILHFLRNILNVSKLTNISRDKNLKKILSEYSFVILNYSKMYKNDKDMLNFYINCYNIYNHIIYISNAKSCINIGIHKNRDRNNFNSNNILNTDWDDNIINHSDYTFSYKPYFMSTRKIEINNKKNILFLFGNKYKFYNLYISSNFSNNNDKTCNTDYLQGLYNLLDKYSKSSNMPPSYLCKDKSYNMLYTNILKDYQADIIKLLEIILFSVSNIVSNVLKTVTNFLKIIIIKAATLMYYFAILNYKETKLSITYAHYNMKNKNKHSLISRPSYSHNKNYFKNNCKAFNDFYNDALQVSNKIVLYFNSYFFNISAHITNNLIVLIKKNDNYNFYFNLLDCSKLEQYTEKAEKNKTIKFGRYNNWNKRKNMINCFSSKYYNSMLGKNGYTQLPFLFFYYYSILNKMINILMRRILANLVCCNWRNNRNCDAIFYISIYRFFLCAYIAIEIRKYLILNMFNVYNNFRLIIIKHFKNIEIFIDTIKCCYSYNNCSMRIKMNSIFIVPIRAIFKKLKFLLIIILSIANYVKANMMIHFCNYFINYSRLFVSFLFLFLFLCEGIIIIYNLKYISLHKIKPNNRKFNINTCSNKIYEHIRYNTEQIDICDNIINKDNMSLFFPFVNSLIIILFFLLLSKSNQDQKTTTTISDTMLSYLHFISSFFNQHTNCVNTIFRNELMNIIFYFYHQFASTISIKNDNKMKKQTYLGCVIISEHYFIYVKLIYFFCVIIYLSLSSFVLYTLILISIQINLNKYNLSPHIYLYIYPYISQDEDITKKNDKKNKNYIILIYNFFVYPVIYTFNKSRKFIIKAIMNKSQSYFNIGQKCNIKNYMFIQEYQFYFIIQLFLEYLHCLIAAMPSLCTTPDFPSPLKPKNMNNTSDIAKSNKHIIINQSFIHILEQDLNMSILGKLQLLPHKMLNLVSANANYNNKNGCNFTSENLTVHSCGDTNEAGQDENGQNGTEQNENEMNDQNEAGTNDAGPNETGNSEAGSGINGTGEDGQGDEEDGDDKKQGDDLNSENCDNSILDNKPEKAKRGRKKKLNDKSRIINKVGLGRKGRKKMDLVNNRDENNMAFKNYYNANYINDINNPNFIQNNNIDEANIKTVNYSNKMGKDIVNQLPNQMNNNFNMYQNNRINIQCPPNFINQNNLNMNNIIGVKQIPPNMNNNFRSNIIKNNFNQMNRNITNPMNPQMNPNNNMANYNVYMALQKGAIPNNIVGNPINKVNYRMSNPVNYNNIYPNINNTGQFPNMNNPKINNVNIYVDNFNKKNSLNIPLGPNNNPSLLPPQINNQMVNQLGNIMPNKTDSNQLNPQLINHMNKHMNEQTGGHIENPMINQKQINFMNNHNNVANMMNNYMNQNPYNKAIPVGPNTSTGVNKNKINENVIINNNNNVHMNNAILRDQSIENNKIGNNNAVPNIAINPEVRRNTLLGLNTVNNNNDANGVTTESVEVNGMKPGIDKPSTNVPNNVNNTSQMRKNGSRSSSCSSINNGMVNEKPPNPSPNLMGPMIYMNNRNMKNEQMEKMIIYDKMGIKNEENQPNEMHNRPIINNIPGNMFYGYHNNMVIHPYFNNMRMAAMRGRVSFVEHNNRHPNIYDPEQINKGNLINNNYLPNGEPYGDHHFHKNKHMNIANNTNLKKKKKNDMKKKKDEDMTNNQNLRTVKMNWNKYDNIFRKIHLKNNYEHIINTEEDKINNLTDVEKDNSKIDSINNNIIDSIGLNIDNQLNINFHKFLKEYDDILKKLNLIKLNDKANFKNQTYNEIYENIFLTIENYLSISELQYKNNFVHTNFYKNCMKYLDKIKSEESQKSADPGPSENAVNTENGEKVENTENGADLANTVEGAKEGKEAKEQKTNNSTEADNNSDEENYVNKKKSNFFESISLSANNRTVLKTLLEKIKDRKQIEQAEQVEKAKNDEGSLLRKNSKMELTKGESNITESSLINQQSIQSKVDENVNEGDIGMVNNLMDRLGDKNAINKTLTNYSRTNSSRFNENNKSIIDNKKQINEEKNITYQNLFIENILSKKYRTYSINEFINVKLNDNLRELIKIYKQNLCYNMKKNLNKKINYIKIYRWLRSNVKSKYIKKIRKLKNSRLIKKKKKKIIIKLKKYIHREIFSGKNDSNLFDDIYKMPNIQGIKINNNEIDPSTIGVGNDTSIFPFTIPKSKKGVNDSVNANNTTDASKLDVHNVINDENLLLVKKEKNETKKNRKNNKINSKSKSNLEENVSIYIQKEIKRKQDNYINTKNPKKRKITQCRNLSIHAYIDKMYNKRNVKRIKKYKKNMNMKYKSNAIIDLGNKIVWISFEFNNLSSLKNIKNNLFESISLSNIQNAKHSENELDNFIINEMEKYKNVKIKSYKLISYYDYMFLKNRLNFVKVQYKKKKNVIKNENHLLRLVNNKNENKDSTNQTTKEVMLKGEENENITSIHNVTESDLNNLEKNEENGNDSKMFNKNDKRKKSLQEYIDLFPIMDKKKLNSHINLNLNIDKNGSENDENKSNIQNIFGELNLNFITKYLNKNVKMESADLCKVSLGKSNEKDDIYDHHENRFKHFINNENVIYNNSVLIDNCIWSNNPILFSIFEKYYLLVKMQKYILQYKKCLKNNIKMDLYSESNLDLHSSSTSDNAKNFKKLSKGKHNKGETLSNLLLRNNQNIGVDIDYANNANTVGARKRRRSKGITTDLKEKIDTSNCSEKVASPDQTDSNPNSVNNNADNLNRKDSSSSDQNKQVADEGSSTLIQEEKNKLDKQENVPEQNKESDDKDADEMLDNENPDQVTAKSSSIIDEIDPTSRDVEIPDVKNVTNEFDNKDKTEEEYNNVATRSPKGRKSELIKSSKQDSVRKNSLTNIEIKKEENFNKINENNVEVPEKKRRGRKKGKKRGRKKGVKNKSKLFINEENQSTICNNKQTNFNGNFTSYDNYKNNSLSYLTKEQINELETQNENDILSSDLVPIDKDIIIDLLCEEDELIESYIKNSRFVDKNLICLLINMNNVQKKLSFICNALLKKIIKENKMPPKISENTKKCEQITYKYIMFERWNQLRYSLFYNLLLINNNIGVTIENPNIRNSSNLNSINTYKKLSINSIFDLHKFATKYKKHKYPPFEYSIFFKYNDFKNVRSITYESDNSDDVKSVNPEKDDSKNNVKTPQDEIHLFINDKDKFCGFSNTTDLNITPIFYHCCVCFNDDYNSMQFGDEEDNPQNPAQNDSTQNVASIPGIDTKDNNVKESNEIEKREEPKDNIKNLTQTNNDNKMKDKPNLDENKTKAIDISGINCKENIVEIENNIKSCKNIMLKCYRCYMHAHKYCYISIKNNEDNNSIAILQNNNIANPNEWLCQRCEFEKKTLGTNYLYLFDSNIKCYICLERGGAFCQIRDHMFIHIFCAIFCVPDLLVNTNINMQNFFEYINLNSLQLTQEIHSIVLKKQKVKKIKNKKIADSDKTKEPNIESSANSSHIPQSEKTNFETKESETNVLNKTDVTTECAKIDDEKENNSQNNNTNKKERKKKQDINNSNKRTRKIYEFFSFIKRDKDTKSNEDEEDNENLKKKIKKTSESDNDEEIKKDNKTNLDNETNLKESKNDEPNLNSYLENESQMSSSDYLSSSLSDMSFFSKFSLKRDDNEDEEIDEIEEKKRIQKIIKGPYILNGYKQEKARCDVCLKTQGILMKCFNMDCEKYMHPLCAFMCGLHIKCKNSNKKFLNFQNKIDYCFPRIFFFIRCINHSVKKCGVVNIYEELIKRRRKYLNRDLYPNIYENIKKERKQKNSLKLKIRNNNLATANNNKNDMLEVLAYNFNYLYPYQYSFFLLPNLYYIKNDICAVCFTQNKKKELLYCKYCNVCVHKTCYLVDTSSLEYFYYKKKKKKKIHTSLVHSKEQKVKHLSIKIKEKQKNIITMLQNKALQLSDNTIPTPQNGEPNEQEISQKMEDETTIKNSNTFKELLKNEINSCLQTASHFNDIECVKTIKKFNKKSNFYNHLKKEEEKLLTDTEDIEEQKLFICDICVNNYNYENVNCILCSRKGGAIKMVRINDYIKTDKNKNKKNNFLKHEKNSVFIHMQCALYSPQIIIHDIADEYYQLYNYDNLTNKEQAIDKQKSNVHSDSEILQLNKENYYDEKQKLLNEFFYKQYTYTNLKKSAKKNFLNIKKNNSTGAPRGRPPLHNTSIEPISENVKLTSNNDNYENRFNKMGLNKSDLFDSTIDVENKNDEDEYDEKIKRQKKMNDIKITSFDQTVLIKDNNNVEQKDSVQPTERRRGRMRKSQSIHNNKKEVQSIEQLKGDGDYKTFSINNQATGEIEKYNNELVKSNSTNFKINNLDDNTKNVSMIFDGINNYYYNLNNKKKNYKIIIKDQLKRYLNKNTCCVCNMTYGYTHKCIETSCNNYFHISCAKIHNFFFEYDYNFLKAHPNITNLDITKIPNSIIFCEVHSKNRRKAKPSIQLFSKLRSFLELANIVVNQMKKKEEIKYNWIKKYFENDQIAMQQSDYKYNSIENKNTKLLITNDDSNYCENDNNFNYKHEMSWENNYTNINSKDENILNSSHNDHQYNSEISKKEYDKNYFIKKNIVNDLDIITDQLKSDESNLFDDNESDINDSDYSEETDEKNKDINNDDDCSSGDDFKEDNNSE